MSGPRPVPTGVLAARGSWRAKARIRDGEPMVAPLTGPCPKWLDHEGRKCWRFVVAELGAVGVLGRSDANIVARYARLWSRWRRTEADAAIAEGESLRERLEVRANGLAALLLKLEESLGLTPSARTRVRSDPGSPGTQSDEQRRILRLLPPFGSDPGGDEPYLDAT